MKLISILGSSILLKSFGARWVAPMAFVAFLSLNLSGCSSIGNNLTTAPRPTDLETGPNSRTGYALGAGGSSISRVNRNDLSSGGTLSNTAVNTYLWRASLETLGFMPMAQVDPFGGVIITDWAAIPNQQTQNERYKMNVFLFGNVLRADAVKVKVFKQVATGNNWQDVAVSPDMVNKLELAILSRAREIKIADTQR